MESVLLLVVVFIVAICYLRASTVFKREKELENPNAKLRTAGSVVGTVVVLVIVMLVILFAFLIKSNFGRVGQHESEPAEADSVQVKGTPNTESNRYLNIK